MGYVDRFSRNVPPRNNGSPNIARSSIDQVISSAQQQSINALSVNSRPVLYFARKLSGTLCSCGHVAASNPDGTTGLPTTPGNHQAAPDGFGTPEFIGSVLQGTSFTVDRYGVQPANANQQAKQDGMPWTPLLDRTSTSNQDPLSQTTVDESAEDFLESASPLLNEAPKSCGVCMNTGYVGGYDPINMLRVSYSTQAPWTSGVGLDESTRPYSFEVLGVPTLEVLVPKAARNLIALRVWNNRELVPGVGIMVAGVPFTSAWRSAVGGTLLVALDFSKCVEKRFTHLEVMYDIGMPPVLVEWSNLEYSENFEVIDQISDVTLSVAPTVPAVALYDIIVEDTFNRSWKVSNVNTKFDREKHVGGWNISARLIQKFEIYNLLPHMKLRTYHWANQGAQPMPQAPGVAPVNPYAAPQATPFR